MKVSVWKRTLLVLLSAMVATPSFADTESLALRMNAGGQNPSLKYVVTAVPEADQAAILWELDNKLNSDPKSAAIVATAGEDDSLHKTPELEKILKNPRVSAVKARTLEEVAAATKKAREYRSKINTTKAREKLKEEKIGIMVSVVPAVGYGSLVMYMSGDYVAATAAFGLMFGMNAFQSIFTKQWDKFISIGDRGMRTVAHTVAKFLGKPLSSADETTAERLGRLGWMTTVSATIASMSMLLSGTLDSTWALLYFGYASSLDVWDKVFESKLAQSLHFQKSFIAGRLTMATILECLMLAGIQQAEMGLVSATVAGTMALLFSPTKSQASIAEPIAYSPPPEKPKLMERIRLKVSDFKQWFGKSIARQPSSYRTCHELLMGLT